MTTCRKFASLLLLISLFAFLAGCGDSGGTSAPAAAKPGTPGFFWATAKNAWQNGDYIRTTENLAKITGSDNEYRARAQAWLLLLSSGLTQGYMESASAFELGAKASPKNVTALRKRASAARSAAKATAMQSVEALHFYTAKIKDEKLALDIGPPAGTLNDPPVLLKIMKGIVPPDAEIEGAQLAMLQKGVLASACRIAGAPSNPAKTIEMFKQQPFEISRPVFLLGIAAAMSDQMALFGPKQLDEPLRQKLLGTEALEAVKAIPATKESKELEKKLEKAVKQIKAS
ncbi:MAG: hypothetical protein HY820_05875 [Acidobacteria bacterium]|nr:hypothetical protein [Acidobacteriota bacterium]